MAPPHHPVLVIRSFNGLWGAECTENAWLAKRKRSHDPHKSAPQKSGPCARKRKEN